MSQDLDPLSLFLLEEEATKPVQPPPQRQSKGFSGMISDIFSEASAFATGSRTSNTFYQQPVVATNVQSQNTAKQQVPDPQQVPKKNIFQDEPGRQSTTTVFQNLLGSSRMSQSMSSKDVSSSGDMSPGKAVPESSDNTNDSENTPLPGSLEDLVANELLTGEQRLMSLRDAFIEVSKGRFMPGILYMTNYRTMFVPTAANLATIAVNNPSLYSWLSIPLACIDRMEKDKRVSRDSAGRGVGINIYSKDMREHHITIQGKSGTDFEVDRALGVLAAYAYPNQLRFMFAFSHNLIGNDGKPVQRLQPYDAVKEYTRQGILDYNTANLPPSTPEANRNPNEFLWRISSANVGFKLCPTYAQLMAMPSGLTDEELFRVSAFRSGQRLPTMSWGSSKNGATLWRSSQPKAGVTASCAQDEKMLALIAKSCTHRGRPPVLYIVDCRPRANAMANKAAGAGYESTSNYPHIKLDFYNIGNIHVMRDSIRSISSLIASDNPSSDTSFGKSMEDTGWLTHIRLVLKASHDSAVFLARGDPVLVHCSHGWDRTAEVCSLTQVLMDPFYRTMAGFMVLVEKEWNSFGHAFTMRCAHGQDKSVRQDDQISPIFLQFIDCMWQLVRQFPHHFEYNTRYLLTIADHIYSGRFVSFLFSSDQEREEANARRCIDIWTYLNCNRELFISPLYIKMTEPKAFLPSLSQVLRNVVPWSEYFYRWAAIPSLLIPAQDFSEHLYKNGTCVGPKLSDVEALQKSSNDLALPAIVNHDGIWEGKYRKMSKFQEFSNRQIEYLTELLRTLNCPEERIANCLAGNFDSLQLVDKEVKESQEAPLVEGAADVGSDQALESPLPSNSDGEDRRIITSNALSEFGLDD